MRLHVGCAMWTHKPWQGRFLPHPLPAERAPAGLRQLVQRGRGQHDVLRDTGPEHRGVVGAADRPRTSGSWSSSRSRSRTSAGWSASTRSSGPSWTRSSRSARAPTRSGCSCRDRSLPPTSRRSAGFLRRLPARHRYAVEVRHRAFFDDPVGAASWRGRCAAAAAEWIPFDTIAFFQSPPTSDAERDAWTKKPRMPRRSRRADRPADRPLPRPRRHRARRSRAGSTGSTTVTSWLREGRSPTVFIHTPDNADAPALARRFHDEVRARVPELDALPEPDRRPSPRPCSDLGAAPVELHLSQVTQWPPGRHPLPISVPDLGRSAAMVFSLLPPGVRTAMPQARRARRGAPLGGEPAQREPQ